MKKNLLGILWEKARKNLGACGEEYGVVNSCLKLCLGGHL